MYGREAESTPPKTTTWVPSSKLAAAGGGFSLMLVASWLLSTYAHVDVPEEVWVALGGGVTWAFGYLKREKRQGV